MGKVLIPINNTPWGNKNGINRYDHVVSFENETIKTQFIGEYLFGNRNFDYLSAIDVVGLDKPILQSNATSAKVMVNVDELTGLTYQGVNLEQTIDDLLNTDSMITKEEGKVKFWIVREATRTTIQNNITITFKLDLDIFFTHLDELEFTGDVMIERAHTDRYEIVDGEVKFLKEYNRRGEDILEGISYREIRWFKPLSDYNPLANMQNWLISYVSLANSYETGDGEGTAYSTFSFKEPYNIYIAPANRYNAYTKVIKDENGELLNWIPYGYDDIRKDMNHISTHIISGPADPFSPDLFDSQGYSEDDGVWIYDIGTTFDKWVDDGKKYYGVWWDKGTGMMQLSQTNPLEYEHEFTVENVVPNINVENIPMYTDEKSMKTEIKLYTEAAKTTLEGINGQPFEVNLDYFNEVSFEEEEFDGIHIPKDVKFGGAFHFNPSKTSQVVFPKNHEFYKIWGAKEFKVGYYEEGKQLPSETVAWEEYIQTNQNQRDWEMHRDGLFGGGRLGSSSGGALTGAALGSVIAPGLGTMIGGGIGAATGLLFGQSRQNIQALKAKEADIQNIPNSVQVSPDNWKADQAVRFNVKLIQRKPTDEMEEALFDYFGKVGYSIGLFGNVEDFLNTRYYHNFVKTGALDTNIVNKFSPDIKAEISATFEQGVTIWHVRDLDTFKGIMNYSYENQELKVIDILEG